MSLQHYQTNSETEFAKHLITLFPTEEIREAIGQSRFQKYQDDPVGFGQDILGDTFTDEIKEMMESVRKYPITVAQSPNAVGKTHGAARVGIWFKKCHPGAQVYTAAAPPESNLKRLLWGEINSITEKHLELFTSDTITSLNIASSALSFLTGVTIPMSGTDAQREAKFSGKHAPYLLFIIDEGDAVPDEVYKGIESCMSGGHARLLVMFNPRAEAGEVYRMIRDGRANIVRLSVFNHPNVVTGKEIIPGAVNRETTVRRINEWCRPLNKDEKFNSECFNLPKFLVGSIAKNQAGITYPPLKAGSYKIMNSAFSYMVLGQYPGQGVNQLIAKEWIARARSRWDLYVAKHGEIPPKGVTGKMGLDVAEFGDDLNCATFRYGGFVEMPITWGGVDVMVSSDRGSEEFKNRDLSDASVDGTGVGAGVAPAMRRKKCVAHNVKVASSPTYKTEEGDFKIMRDQLWWSLREWLKNDPGSMLPPDEELLEELRIPTYETVNGKVRVMDKDTMKDHLKRSPNKADSLALTFFKGDMIVDPVDIDKCAV